VTNYLKFLVILEPEVILKNIHLEQLREKNGQLFGFGKMC
jgi:hypothetical protein